MFRQETAVFKPIQSCYKHPHKMKYFILQLSMLACCAAQEVQMTPPPPNRVLPVFSPELDLVFAAQLPPETTPVFKPRSIPPNRKVPIISKADIVMAATDRVGILVNNLAHDMAADLADILNNLPAPGGPRRAMETLENQQAAWEGDDSRDSDPQFEDSPRWP